MYPLTYSDAPALATYLTILDSSALRLAPPALRR